MKTSGCLALLGLWLACSEFTLSYVQAAFGDGECPNTTFNSPASESNQRSNITSHPNYGLINSPSCGRTTRLDISPGSNTVLFEVPWMVRLVYQNARDLSTTISCSGTLIGDRYVLTAAHCLAASNIRTLVSVRLGDHDTSTEEDCEDVEGTRVCAPLYQEILVESVVLAAGYEPGQRRNDFGLVRLQKTANLTKGYVNTICLPENLGNQAANLVGKTMLVAGWGGHGQEVRKALMTVISSEQCQATYITKNVDIDDNELCASYVQNEHGICKPISGGPLMSPELLNGAAGMVQYGICHYGPRFTNLFPDVFVRVEEHMEWILNNIAP